MSTTDHPGADRPTERPTTTPRGTARLLAVFEDPAAADRAAAELRGGGVSSHLADEGEVRDELVAEMQQESRGMSKAMMPGAPIHTEEMTRWAVPSSIAAAVAFGALGALVSLLLDIPNTGTAQEVAWFAGIGATFGATAAWFLGGLVGSRLSNHVPAAQRGTTLVVEDGTQASADVLVRHDPIRIDRQDPDGTTLTVVTEADLHPGIDDQRAGRQVRGTDRADD